MIGSIQTYELGLPSHKFRKSIALKLVEELKCSNPEESDIEKEVAYLAKSFKKFLKFKKNSGRQDDKPFRKSSDSKREFQRMTGERKTTSGRNLVKDHQIPQLLATNVMELAI